MTSYLYIVPLPEAQTGQPPAGSARARLAGAGLIQQAGFVSERIAIENVDLTIRGQYRAAEFSKKLKRELESLSQSDYEGVPLADDANLDADDQKAYYNIQQRDINRAHQTSTLSYRYTIGLQEKGTKRTHWRAVPTTVETVNTGLATSGNGLVGLPTESTKVRWWDPVAGGGTEVASIASTVTAEFGDVDRYDPSASTFTDPTLLYELPFDREGPVDVRVWDDVGSPNAKFVTYGGTDITQWVHAYHPAFDFEGAPIVDNGLLRLRFDEANGQIDADEWDTGTSSWVDLATVGGSAATYELFDVDLRAYSPVEVEAFTEWQDTSDDSIHAAVIKAQRGVSRAVVRQPANGTMPSDLETMLDPIAGSQTTDAQPSQTVQSKGEVQ